MGVANRSLTGRKSLYRHKRRGRPVSVLLTDVGHMQLLRLCEQHVLSRSDLIEALLRGDVRVPAELARRER